MKRILAVVLAMVVVLALSSCGGTDQDRDLYHYDTFLNAKWGSDPDEVFSDLGLSKTQVARQGETVDQKVVDVRTARFGRTSICRPSF